MSSYAPIKGITKIDISVMTGLLTAGSGLATFLFGKLMYTHGVTIAIASMSLSVLFLVLRLRMARRKNAIDYESHVFFSNMEYYINQKIPRIRVDDPLRTKLLRVTMRAKYTAGLKHIRNFVLNEKVINVNTMKAMVSTIVDDYEREWAEANVPQVFIDKFYIFHKPKIDSLTRFIEQVNNSHLLCRSGKIVALLYQMQTTYDSTLLDLEEANSAINGELTAELTKLRNEGLF